MLALRSRLQKQKASDWAFIRQAQSQGQTNAELLLPILPGEKMIETLLLFYGFHGLDATTTTWGLNLGAKEGNILARPFVRPAHRLFAFKFVLASLVLYVSLHLPIGHWLIYFDTIVEGAVTAWNTCVMWEKATGRKVIK